MTAGGGRKGGRAAYIVEVNIPKMAPVAMAARPSPAWPLPSPPLPWLLYHRCRLAPFSVAAAAAHRDLAAGGWGGRRRRWSRRGLEPSPRRATASRLRRCRGLAPLPIVDWLGFLDGTRGTGLGRARFVSAGDLFAFFAE
jgi:hypothetical protein